MEIHRNLIKLGTFVYGASNSKVTGGTPNRGNSQKGELPTGGTPNRGNSQQGKLMMAGTAINNKFS